MKNDSLLKRPPNWKGDNEVSSLSDICTTLNFLFSHQTRMKIEERFDFTIMICTYNKNVSIHKRIH